MVPFTDEDALHISSELRNRRSAARKRNLKASKPLKSYPKITNCDTSTYTDAKAQRTALQQTLQAFDLLPSNSAYAKHRRATVQKALDLLDAERYQDGPLQTCRPALVCTVTSVLNLCTAGMQSRTLSWRSCLSALTSNDAFCSPCVFVHCSQQVLFQHSITDRQHALSGQCPCFI